MTAFDREVNAAKALAKKKAKQKLAKRFGTDKKTFNRKTGKTTTHKRGFFS